MALMAPPKTANAGGGTYEESEEEKAAWKQVRQFVRDQRIAVDGRFKVKGYISKFIENDGSIFYVTERTDDKTGKAKDWVAVKVLVTINDPRFGEYAVKEGLTLPPKTIGASFFDGDVGKKEKLPTRGGMYHVHRAIFHAEPPKTLVKSGAFDPDLYVNEPLLVEVIFKGAVEKDSQYFGRRGNLTLFVQGFDLDPDSPRYVSPLAAFDDDEQI